MHAKSSSKSWDNAQTLNQFHLEISIAFVLLRTKTIGLFLDTEIEHQA